MSPTISGIHHVTAITGDAQANIDFYTTVLGLRLVKVTVNFDDPGTYHLYYGDELGRPGTIVTFFAWPGARRGTIAPPQVTAISLSAPVDSLDHWTQRLKEHNVATEPIDRFNLRILRFNDPDGLNLEIVASAPAHPQHSIHAMHSVTLTPLDTTRTTRVLTEVMGFVAQESEDDRFRFRAGKGQEHAAIVDVVAPITDVRGATGVGVVHHVAFRVPDDASHQTMRNDVARIGLNVTPIIERHYFRSIYFREPGGILFEIATDKPGFTIDESPEQLGSRLVLPPHLERHRKEIERLLPPVRLPTLAAAPES